MKRQEEATRYQLNKFKISINELKQKLHDIGFYKGQIDGEFNQELADSISEFQKDSAVTPVDGTCGSKTLSKLAEVINLKSTLK